MRAKSLLVWLLAFLALGSRCTVLRNSKCVKSLRDLTRAYRLDLLGPFTYTEADLWCNVQGMILLTPITNLISAAERALCGDQFVPIGKPWAVRESLKALFEEASSYDASFNITAANLLSGRWRHVRPSHEFACVICQHDDVPRPFGNDDNAYEDETASWNFVVHLVSAGECSAGRVSQGEKHTLKTELYGAIKPKSELNNTIKFHRTWLDDSKHLHIDFWVNASLPVGITTDNVTTSVLDSSYVMLIEDVQWCPAGETVDFDGVVTQWPATRSYSERFATDASSGAITRRDCSFNYDTYRGEWDPRLSRWELVWRNCTSDEQYVNEVYYKPLLDAVDIDRRHVNALQELALAPVNTTTFPEVARLVDREMKAQNKLYEQTERHLVNITAHLAMDSGSDHFVATAGRADLIVADLGGSYPVVGFTLECDLNAPNAIDNVTLNRNRTVEGRALFALDVSARLSEAHSRMAFVVAWKFIPLWEVIREHIKAHQFIEVTVMFPRKAEVSAWTFTSYGNHHVDITYNTTQPEPVAVDLVNYLVCFAWSNQLREWTTEGCKTLYSGNISACRCSGKYFFLQDGVPIARFALKKGYLVDKSAVRNDIFTDFLKDKIALMTVTAIECLLSLLGLGSIIGTASLFKHWRQNAGHKILLHMVLALTCNLVLGFTANFVGMNTEGVGCLVYGVLRHYSFLAMFLWMLVLSLLQLKRLTTVASAKAITHLILKVSVFAWGVPLVPIIILLSWNPGIYQTDRFERGYCYPEGLVFQVTVQGPAGFILLVNLGIFAKIVLHIFGCVGENKIKRHSKKEKAEHLNKLKTSMFVFFLFGFTWVFHILSEERVVVSDFLFEYLFLMTATMHIFTLALFFVVFQESTRKEWINMIRKKFRKQ